MKVLSNSRILPRMMLLSGLVFCTTACNNKLYREIPPRKISPEVTRTLNIVSQENNKILEGSNCEKYGEDTLLLQPEYITNPELLRQYLNEHAASNAPMECVGTKIGFTPIQNGNGVILAPRRYEIYEPKYKSNVAIVNSNKLFTKNGRDIYVPLEYFGTY